MTVEIRLPGITLTDLDDRLARRLPACRHNKTLFI